MRRLAITVGSGLGIGRGGGLSARAIGAEVGKELDGKNGVDAHDDNHDEEGVGNAGNSLDEGDHDLVERGYALEEAKDAEGAKGAQQRERRGKNLPVWEWGVG